VWCSVVQCGAVWCSVVQCGVVWYSVVQCGVVWYSVVQCGTVWYSVLQCGAVWYSVVQCVSVCCSVASRVLQCVTVWYSVLQSVAVYTRLTSQICLDSVQFLGPMIKDRYLHPRDWGAVHSGQHGGARASVWTMSTVRNVSAQEKSSGMTRRKRQNQMPVGRGYGPSWLYCRWESLSGWIQTDPRFSQFRL